MPGHQKPPPTTSSLTLVMVVDHAGDGVPNFGDTVTFAIQTNQTTQPNVSLNIYQGGVLVQSSVAGFYDSYPWPWTKNMQLGPTQSWTSGAAEAVATLYYFNGRKTPVLATLKFSIGA